MNINCTLSFISMDVSGSTGTIDGDNGAHTMSMQSGSTVLVGPNTGTLQLGVAGNLLSLNLLGQVSFSAPGVTQLIVVAGSLEGSGGITKLGSGRLRFNADNSGYSGTVTVSVGTFILFTSGGLGSGSAILNGGTLSLQNVATAFGSPVAVNSVAGNAFDVPGIASTASGFLTGSGGFTKTGSGTLTLSHTNSYSGGTSIVAGMLQLGSVSGVGSGSVTVGSGTIFNVNSYAPVIATLSGAGSVTLGSGTLTAGDSTATTFSGLISGTGPFIKQGSGSITFSGTNSSYSGGTFITGGMLVIAGDGSLGAAPGSPATNLTFSGSGGTLQASSNFTMNANRSVSVVAAATFDTHGQLLSVPGLVSGSGTLTVAGNGTLTSGPIRVDTLNISGTTYHSLIAGQSDSGTVLVNHLSIATNTSSAYTGTLDINDDKLIVQAADTTSKVSMISQLTAAALSGSATGFIGGTWAGTGLKSATLAGETGSSYHASMAIADNGALASPFSIYGGQSVNSNSILVTRALVGDGNLDNTTNNADVVILFNHFGASGSAANWTTGDYDQNGTVNNADLVALDNDFNQSLPGGFSVRPGGAEGGAAPAAVAVPEPAGLGMLLAGIPMLRRLRRRR